jgi:hypothetical protein
VVTTEVWHAERESPAFALRAEFPDDVPSHRPDGLRGLGMRVVGVGITHTLHSASITPTTDARIECIEAGLPMRALCARAFRETDDATERVLARPRGRSQVMPSWLAEGVPIRHVPEPLFNKGAKGTWQSSDPRLYEGRHLPLVPIPLGFAVNTLVYAAPMLAVFVALPMVRARRRRTRGLCPSCGYDRSSVASDAPCPECAAVP